MQVVRRREEHMSNYSIIQVGERLQQLFCLLSGPKHLSCRFNVTQVLPLIGAIFDKVTVFFLQLLEGPISRLDYPQAGLTIILLRIGCSVFLRIYNTVSAS